MFVKQKFITRLKTLREEKGVSTRKLGSAIGISSPAISQFENGSALPALDTLVALAQFFNVSVDYLLGISDNPSPPAGDNSSKVGEFVNNPLPAGYPDNESIHAQTNESEQEKIDELVNGLDEESMVELRKYVAYLRIRQTLDGGKDESSAGLDGGKASNGKKGLSNI